MRDSSPTFADNMSLPVHRWFKYTAGFSAGWVKQLLQDELAAGRRMVLDPFLGSGTVALQSDFEGVSSIGIEAHPFIYRIAKAKLDWWYDWKRIEFLGKEVLRIAKYNFAAIEVAEMLAKAPKLLKTCYTDEALSYLFGLRIAFEQFKFENDIEQNLIWFIISSILRPTSHVGTAQWQYILPKKSKSNVQNVFGAFEHKTLQVVLDMKSAQQIQNGKGLARIIEGDARTLIDIPDNWADLVITSPPYANNYDYADATRLELTFWGEVHDWSGLQLVVRNKLIRACTQQVSGIDMEIEIALSSARLNPISLELQEVYHSLAKERLTKGGKKNYHLMIVAYFKDMADTMHSLRRCTKDGVKMCFVIGDSAPYGVHVPVDRWLGEIALNSGFTDFHFEKLRDRNIKWKNRKHRVPLQEGRLWING